MSKKKHSPPKNALLDQSNSQSSEVRDEKRELGFGSKLYRKGIRLINKDGTFNFERRGEPWYRPYDLYNTLIKMSWLKFFGLVFLYYFTLNLIFSLLYLAVGIEGLTGTLGETPFEHFLDAYFFSAQTVTTLGYGRISPVGNGASVIAATESLIGLLGFALVTGIMYGRFARPNAKIRFSKNMLVSPYMDGTGLMFRLVNMRSSELIEIEVQVIASIVDIEMQQRVFKDLELQLQKINFLALSWTVNHIITEDSPLYGLTLDDLKARDAEFIILVKAFDDVFSQTVYQRHSYIANEIVYGAKFKSIIHPTDDNLILLELDHIDDYQFVEI